MGTSGKWNDYVDKIFNAPHNYINVFKSEF